MSLCSQVNYNQILGNKLDSEHDIGIRVTQSLSVVLITIMGFANLLTAEIAADYSRPVARVFSLYNLEIAEKSQKGNYFPHHEGWSRQGLFQA